MNNRMLLLALVACLLALACSADGEGGEADHIIAYRGSEMYDDFVGASTASVEERIWQADVIVRATLVSAQGDVLNFRAVEYLKGTGPATFTVSAATAGRPTQWDDREAVLFLASGGTPGGAGGAGQGAPRSDGSTTTTSFEFADTTAWSYFGEAPSEYAGTLPEGYVVGTRNPVWLPSTSAGGASGQRSAPPSGYQQGDGTDISLADLRQKIAWVEGGAGVAGYDDCIAASLDSIRYYRDLAAYGEPWVTKEAERRIDSGQAGGSVIFDVHSSSIFEPPLRYKNWWLLGQDAGHFSVQNVDTDSDPTNGYRSTITTARPLPRGTYQFLHQLQLQEYIPCNFRPEDKFKWRVVVTAPAQTTHEAMFDPAAVGTAVGADANERGRSMKAGFTAGGTATTIQALKWEGGVVTLQLSPAASLSGYDMDVIELDGSTSLTLSVADATSNAGGTLTWAVANQPWHAGDQLMLRIRTA